MLTLAAMFFQYLISVFKQSFIPRITIRHMPKQKKLEIVSQSEKEGQVAEGRKKWLEERRGNTT